MYRDDKLKVRDNLVPGTVVMGERNFCRLRFEGTRAERQMVLASITADGKTQWSHTMTAAELGAEYKPPAAAPK